MEIHLVDELLTYREKIIHQTCARGTPEYAAYGAFGISVCGAWLQSADTFVTWSIQNGWCPGRVLYRGLRQPVVLNHLNRHTPYGPTSIWMPPVSSFNIRVLSRWQPPRTLTLPFEEIVSRYSDREYASVLSRFRSGASIAEAINLIPLKYQMHEYRGTP